MYKRQESYVVKHNLW